ncbi:MAG TPA: DUF4936 family protein [Noviherbaspirillum sp.]
MDLYVYYRVPNANAGTLHARIEALQQCLRRDYGIVTGLKRRPEEKDGRQTWMEIYLAVPDGFENVLDTSVAQAGLTELIDGRRNTEHFVDVPPCA